MWLLIQFLFGIFLAVMSFQDIRTRRLPLVQMLAGPMIVVCARILIGRMEYLSSMDFLLSLVCSAFFLGISWIGHEKIGYADTIAIAGIFFCAGYETGMFIVFISFLIAGVAAVILLLSGKAGRKTAIPFLPFLCAGYTGGIVLTL